MGSSAIIPRTNQTAFTFFSEVTASWEGNAPIEATVLVAIMISAFIGNSMVLLSVYRNSKMQKPTNFFICNLAVADMLFATWIPFIVITRITRHWIFGNAICKTVTYVQFVSGICSILTLMMISIERYIHVCQMHRKMNNLVAGIVISTTWVLSFSFPVPVALVQSEQCLVIGNGTFHYCGIAMPENFHIDVYLSFMVIFFFFIPLIVIIFNYYRIFRVVKVSSKCTSNQRHSKRTQKQIRLNKMFVVIVCTFVVMWLPFFIVSFLAVYLQIITSTVFTLTIIIALANTSQNPIIYGFLNTKFRNEFKAICNCGELGIACVIPRKNKYKPNAETQNSCFST